MSTTGSHETDERRLLAAFFDAQQRMDVEAVLACWCADGVMNTPYAPPPLPRTRGGEVALRRMFDALFSGSTAIVLDELELVGTEVTGLWLARWTFEIRLRSGATYSGRDIGTFELRDGRIAEYTEYFDPVAFAKCYGVELPR